MSEDDLIRQTFIAHVITNERQGASVDQMNYEIKYNKRMQKRYTDWKYAYRYGVMNERERLANLADEKAESWPAEYGFNTLSAEEIRRGG